MDNKYLVGPALEPIPNTRPVRALYSRTGFTAFGFILSAQVLGFVMAMIYSILAIDPTANESYIVIASIGQYILAMPVCYLIIRSAPKSIPQKRKLKARYLLLALAVSVMLAQVGSLLGLSLSGILSDLFGQDISDPLSSHTSILSPIANLLILGILAPIFEELLFRKLIIDHSGKFGVGASVFISAFLFGAIHCNVYQFFYAFLMGLLLSYVYAKTGRIIYPILIHSFFNICLGVIPSIITSKIENIDPTLATVDPWQALYVLYVLFQLFLLILGIVLFCVNIKKVKADIVDYAKNVSELLPCILLNGGVIITFISTVAIFMVNTFLS